jgi:DNA-binding transcriptional LysR family regulator
MINDLNDLYYFYEVVSHGGFAAAGRAVNEPKSKLSRRISQLENRLGVRLIERSTRRFRVTDVGQVFFERCRDILMEAEKAQATASESQGEAKGLVRFSCPPAMLEVIGPVAVSYLEAHPGVCLEVLATNSAVDLIEQRVDVALRVRGSLDADTSLTMRTLASSQRVLVGSPKLAAQVLDGSLSQALRDLPTLGFGAHATDGVWTLVDGEGALEEFRHTPRLESGELAVLRAAAIAGLGVALLPDFYCRRDFDAGTLVRILPQWRAQPRIVHIVFTTKRGLPPAVRLFIDYVSDAFRRDPQLRDLLR